MQHPSFAHFVILPASFMPIFFSPMVLSLYWPFPRHVFFSPEFFILYFMPVLSFPFKFTVPISTCSTASWTVLLLLSLVNLPSFLLQFLPFFEVAH